MPRQNPIRHAGAVTICGNRSWIGAESAVLPIFAALGSLFSLIGTRKDLALENLALRQQLALFRRAQWMSREGVHSACARWELGMCSARVVGWWS